MKLGFVRTRVAEQRLDDVLAFAAQKAILCPCQGRENPSQPSESDRHFRKSLGMAPATYPRVRGFGLVKIRGGTDGHVLRGPVCINVEDDTFGKTLEGREWVFRTTWNVLMPFF